MYRLEGWYPNHTPGPSSSGTMIISKWWGGARYGQHFQRVSRAAKRWTKEQSDLAITIILKYHSFLEIVHIASLLFTRCYRTEPYVCELFQLNPKKLYFPRGDHFISIPAHFLKFRNQLHKVTYKVSSITHPSCKVGHVFCMELFSRSI